MGHVRGGVCLWGGPELFGVFKGGNSFFSVGQRGGGNQRSLRVKGGWAKIFDQGGGRIFSPGQRGGPEFFHVGKGGYQKILATGLHKQMAPIPGKK